jgi:hypothetical protein
MVLPSLWGFDALRIFAFYSPIVNGFVWSFPYALSSVLTRTGKNLTSKEVSYIDA